MASYTLSILPITSISQSRKQVTQHSLSHNSSILGSNFVGEKLSIRSSNLTTITSKQRSLAMAAVSFSPPTIKQESSSSEKVPKWSLRVIKACAMGAVEAWKLKYPKTGTEALLLGILVEGTSLAARFLRENGITFFKVQEETLSLLGSSYSAYSSPENPPYTEQAQKALDWAVNEKLKSGDNGEITVAYLVLGIWSQKESAGHKIMTALGFDDKKAEELAKSMDKDIFLSFK